MEKVDRILYINSQFSILVSGTPVHPQFFQQESGITSGGLNIPFVVCDCHGDFERVDHKCNVWSLLNKLLC